MNSECTRPIREHGAYGDRADHRRRRTSSTKSRPQAVGSEGLTAGREETPRPASFREGMAEELSRSLLDFPTRRLRQVNSRSVRRAHQRSRPIHREVTTGPQYPTHVRVAGKNKPRLIARSTVRGDERPMGCRSRCVLQARFRRDHPARRRNRRSGSWRRTPWCRRESSGSGTTRA